MKKKIILALCSLLIATSGVGMSSLPNKEQPVSQELLAEAMEEEVKEVIEEVAEVKVCQEGCTLEEGHEGDCIIEEVEEIEVILKSTSMERDLKVKFVDKKTGKLISGADFKMKLTNPSKKAKEYSDHDSDGIIWVKDIEGGTYTVEMLELEGYVTAAMMKAEVKNKIEYKVVEIVEEVKKESEIVVSQEDAAYGGNGKDESTSGSAVLQDTVEFVASTKTEVTKAGSTQKKDSFGQPMYEKQAVDSFGQKVYKEQKKDEFGTPMYAKIKSEPASYHKDEDKNNFCDRCGASMKKTCTHIDNDNDGKCDNCKEAVSGLHQHKDANGDCKCDGCGSAMHTKGNNGLCAVCNTLQYAEEHTQCIDANADVVCDYCGAAVQTEKPEGEKGQPDNKEEKPEENEQQPETHGCADGEDEDTLCDTCGQDLQPVSTVQEESEEAPVVAMVLRPFMFLRAAQEKIVYDTTSAPVYDETSAPVYDTTSPAVYETETTYVYTGWQTIDGATYYFDKNGNKVTGQQVIEGVSYTFSDEGVRSGNIGIDVSKYQTGINWTKVKNAGINFVMIRCGYRGYGSGVLVEDPMYASHISGAKAAGLRVGVYFFSQAVNEAEAVEEASMAVALAKKYGINMPIAIDSEYAAGGRGRADGLSKSARTTITKAFCNTIRNAGYTPMVYASKAWFSDHLNVSELSGYRIWVAHYSNTCGYIGNYHIWQNTDKGKVDGVPGYVDMNISSI